MSRFVLPFADVGSGVKPASGAKLFFFDTNTSTPKDTFSDEALTIANTNPVIADGRGRFSDIWLESGKYKVQLKTNSDTQKWEADPVESTDVVTGPALDQIPANSDLRIGTVSLLRLKEPTVDGQQISLLGHSIAGIGGGKFSFDASDTSSTDNNGTVIVTTGGNRWIRESGVVLPDDFGVIANDETGSIMLSNLTNMQALIDATERTQYVAEYSRDDEIFTDGTTSLKIRSERVLNNLNIHGTSTTNHTIEAEPISGEPVLYAKNVIFSNCFFRSDNQSAVSGVFWQGIFSYCEFTAPLGSGLRIIGDDLTTGNRITYCYFNGCMFGLVAQEGITDKPTDMHINNNRFWEGSGSIFSNVVDHILLEGSSGTELSKNHYFGNVTGYFLNIASGGFAVRITDEYYERNATGTNGVIFLAGGNGANYTFTSNHFWCELSTNPLITVSRNQRCNISFTANKFHECTDRKLFDVIGSATSLMRIHWAADNMIDGTISSDAFADQFIFEEPLTQIDVRTTRFETVGLGDSSQLNYTESGFGTGTLTLAITDDTVDKVALRVVNDQDILTLTISLSGTAIGLGFTLRGQSVLAPGEIVDLEVDELTKVVYLK